MSVKLQLLRTKFPEEVFQVTMNHLNALVDILKNSDSKANEDVLNLVYESIDYVNKVIVFTYLDLLRNESLRLFNPQTNSSPILPR